MTLGEKIREARRKRGMSQEQLAKRMAVSRSAVAKWETDKGLPDVGNLKVLARLLLVSVDYLLDEAEAAETVPNREPYDLAAYGYGCKRVKKDRVIREKYPDASICPLLGRQEPGAMELRTEESGDCRTMGLDRAKAADLAFYLVETGEQQLLVTVSDVYVQSRLLEQPIQDSSFRLDGWSFVKCNYVI